MNTVTCKFCGHTQFADTKFCMSCGKKIEISVEMPIFMTDKLVNSYVNNNSQQKVLQQEVKEKLVEEKAVEKESVEEIKIEPEIKKEPVQEEIKVETAETTADIKEPEDEPLLDTPMYSENEKVDVVASYRVPVVQKKTRNRTFFWLFIIFFMTSIGLGIFSFITYKDKELFLEFYLNDIVIKDFEANKPYKKGSKINYSFEVEGNGKNCSEQYLYIKILNPDGSLRQGKDSPKNYTYYHKLPSEGKEFISGEDIDLSSYEKGLYKLHLYYKGKSIYKIYLNVK